jgi:hypothetical protein
MSKYVSEAATDILLKSDVVKSVKAMKLSPEVEKLTLALTSTAVATHDSDRKKILDENYKAVKDATDRGVPIEDTMKTPEWKTLTIPQGAAAIKYANPKDTKHDNKAWVEYLGLTPEQLEDMSALEVEVKYWSKFDRARRTRAENAWQAASEKDAPKLTSIITPSTMAENMWRSLGLGKPTDNPEVFAELEQDFQDQVYHFETTQLGGKRKATRDELKTILNDIAMERILVDVDLSYWPFGTTRLPFGQVAPGTVIEGVEFGDVGERRVGGTKKGPGFLGTLQRPDGKVSTELSIGINIDNQEMEIPLLVPTLNKDEIDYLLQGGEPTSKITEKAVTHARKRITAGKSPFKQTVGYQTGEVYTDAQGRLAKYLGDGKWQMMK